MQGILEETSSCCFAIAIRFLSLHCCCRILSGVGVLYVMVSHFVCIKVNKMPAIGFELTHEAGDRKSKRAGKSLTMMVSHTDIMVI
jgi:hypothetical protein